MEDYIISNSGVKVWKTPESHPLLKHTDTTHPAFLAKLKETYSRGKVKGLSRMCSINSEDARTWYHFSPLLSDSQMRTRKLTRLLRQSFPETLSDHAIQATPYAELEFWQGIAPPANRLEFKKEGPSEPDVLIKLTQLAVVLVEAKCRSDVCERTTYDETRDQVIRLIDVGSWYTKQHGYESSYVIVLQYGNAQTNAEDVVSRYAGNPETIQRALHYRDDLKESDYERLARSVAFVRWPDPMGDDRIGPCRPRRTACQRHVVQNRCGVE